MHHPGETVENVLNLGSILAGPDAERAAKMAQSAAPFSHLIVDFSRVRECDDAAFLYLIHALKQLVELDLTVDLHGMTHDQRRLLKDLGHRTEASTGVA